MAQVPVGIPNPLPVVNATFPTPDDLHDIQGDVVLGIPKRYEEFIFFVITNVPEFKRDLKQLIPTITTTAQIQALRREISGYKALKNQKLVKVIGTTIAFTHEGLLKLGRPRDEHIGEVPSETVREPFETGQFANAQALGDRGNVIGGQFDPEWLQPFKGDIHGLISVVGESKQSVDEGVQKIKHICRDSITIVFKVEGKVRPGDQKGHEHFGFLDGISNPAIDALTGHLPGQLVVNPGILLCLQDGDPVSTRPAWTKNGSFLVYRHLKQLVPEFNKFLHDNPIGFPELPREQGAALLGARFIGRWKSGAPIQLTPTKDDKKLADDPLRNNWFDYIPDDVQERCPFAAHIRKTRPRNDLTIFGPDVGKSQAISRSGIPFGPEVTPEEERHAQTRKDRGLAFVCYQSNLNNGFEFIQKQWCNNVSFPPRKIGPNGLPVEAGFDPIVGQNGNLDRTVNGMNTNDPTQNLPLPNDFVVSQGGAYFFTPSITALKETLSV